MSVELLKLEEKAKDKIEAVVIDPDELVERMDLFIKVDAAPSPRSTTDLDKLMAESKFNLYAQYPQIFNVIDAARDLAEVMGDNPDDVVLDPSEQQPPMGATPPPQGATPPPQGMEANPMEVPPSGTPNPQPSMKDALGLPR